MKDYVSMSHQCSKLSLVVDYWCRSGTYLASVVEQEVQYLRESSEIAEKGPHVQH